MSELSLTKKTGAAETLTFGLARLATNIFSAFSAFYLMGFYTDVARLSPAATAALLLILHLLSAAVEQAVGLLINRSHFKNGKYRPYFKWCALPFAVSLIMLGLTPYIGAVFQFAYAAITLLLCELWGSTLNTASLSMLPYLADDDVNRTRFVSYSNAGGILAYLIVGTLMTPLAGFLGGGDSRAGFALTLSIFAVLTVPLHINAYRGLREGRYPASSGARPSVRDLWASIVKNKRIMLFLAGYCVYAMADSFKGQTTYYYMIYNMGRPDLLPIIIMAGLLAPLAIQPVIPRLLKWAGKEVLIVAGLFTASAASLLMWAAGNRPWVLLACVVLYGAATAVAANLVFTLLASFADEIFKKNKLRVSEILTVSMGLSSKIGVAAASGIAPLTLSAFGYVAQNAAQSASALTGVQILFVFCAAVGMALAGLIFSRLKRKEDLPA